MSQTSAAVPATTELTWKTVDLDDGTVYRYTIAAHIDGVPLILRDSPEHNRWDDPEYNPDHDGHMCFGTAYTSTEDGIKDLRLVSDVDPAALDLPAVLAAAEIEGRRMIAYARAEFMTPAEFRAKLREYRAAREAKSAVTR
jgi:hypothetical protein